MSIIETITDVDNTFLSRRELTCNFTGLGGKLKKLESVDMINKEFNLDGKVIIPMGLKTHVGKSTVTGTFFVYDDEGLAKKHINPTIFSRLEKAKSKLAEEEAASKEVAAEPAKEVAAEPAKEVAAEPAKEVAAEPAKEVAAEPAKEVAAEPAKEVAAEAPAETVKEEKSE